MPLIDNVTQANIRRNETMPNLKKKYKEQWIIDRLYTSAMGENLFVIVLCNIHFTSHVSFVHTVVLELKEKLNQ